MFMIVQTIKKWQFLQAICKCFYWLGLWVQIANKIVLAQLELSQFLHPPVALYS